MYISLNWLKQYVDLPNDIDPKELAVKLTMATVEVEDIQSTAESLNHVVVGKIIKIDKHPNADKLKLVDVNIGDKQVTVVCGGSNLKEDMLVALALPGAVVKWHGEGDLVELQPAKVRGVESAGMICASAELGLSALFPSSAPAEIIDLSDSGFSVGAPLARAMGLGDTIYEIDNKSLTNRPDLWGHYGLAREVAAIYGLTLKPAPEKKIKAGKGFDLKVRVDDGAACPRYLAVAIQGIKVADSPAWLKERLLAIGQKPINNIVDITNYVMYDLGQPLHAFSADRIENKEIILRRAEKAEKMVTLDGVERILSEDDLVIADAERAIALAGVMGNANSEIEAATETVVIESANFEPVTIRKTADRFGLRTEAAIRFEKSLDPNLAERAMKKAVNLILEIIPSAKVVSEIIDVDSSKLEPARLNLTWDFIDERIGAKIEKSKIIQILTRLGFSVKERKQGIVVGVPTWRATKDIGIAEDIIEEITRIFGYDNLEPQMPAVKIDYYEENKVRVLERQIKNILALAGGANEVYNYSFVSRSLIESLGQSMDHLELENPWAEDLCLMRKSLIPNILKNVIDNLRYRGEINIFETGKVFLPGEKGDLARPDTANCLPRQDLLAAGAVYLNQENNFFEAKGIGETIFAKLAIEVEYNGGENLPVWCHPGQSLRILLAGETIGYLATIHPQVAQNLQIPSALAVWEINLNKLAELFPSIKKFQALPKFPAVELDLSVIVGEREQWKDIRGLVMSVVPDLIKRVYLLDVFKNGKIKTGEKSLTFRVVYQADDRTLEMEEVNKLQARVVGQLEKGVGAQIRK